MVISSEGMRPLCHFERRREAPESRNLNRGFRAQARKVARSYRVERLRGSECRKSAGEGRVEKLLKKRLKNV